MTNGYHPEKGSEKTAPKSEKSAKKNGEGKKPTPRAKAKPKQ